MNNTDKHILLKDFVAWVRRRRTIQQDAWVDEQTLEYVTQGIERFLDGKNPWPKSRGTKAKRDVMWECYFLTNFAERDSPHMPQHTEEGGAFTVVGDRLNISAKTVESHTSKARKLLDTETGRSEFMSWLSKYRYGGGSVALFPPEHSLAEAERKRRDATGVGNRYTKAEQARRKKAISSGEIDPKLPDTGK